MRKAAQLLSLSPQSGAGTTALPAAVAGPAILLIYVIAQRASGLVVEDICIALANRMPGWNLGHQCPSEHELEAKKKVPVSSTRTSAELGTTQLIYAGSVVVSVIPLTHLAPALLDKCEEHEQHLIETPHRCSADNAPTGEPLP